MADGVTGEASGGMAAAKARKRRSREHSLVIALRVAVLALLVVGMYLLNARSGNLIMPKPTDVLTQSWLMWTDGTMLQALGESLSVLCLGFLLAASTGVAGGILLGGFRTVGRVLEPFVNAMNATPGAAFIPLIIVWFGLYTEAKVVVVWNAAVFPILISTAAGIDNSDNDLVEMGKSFGASRAMLFWQVMVPNALPSILSGLRIGAAVATVGTIVSELYMAQSGLGGLIAAAGNRFQMARYFAVVIVVMALGSLITWLLRLAENRLSGWRASLREAN
ncbi:MAG TPA: ABC transporter permease [Devosiaceae bacterium]|jgi:NitT/TauT family transport system permease protein